jgi:hypothetical protein
VLLEFYKYPAEHWIPSENHESHRVDLRDRQVADQGDQGPGSRAAGIAMAYKLIDAAQARWRLSTHRISSPSSEPARHSTRASYSNGLSTSHPRHRMPTRKP